MGTLTTNRDEIQNFAVRQTAQCGWKSAGERILPAQDSRTNKLEARALTHTFEPHHRRQTTKRFDRTCTDQFYWRTQNMLRLAVPPCSYAMRASARENGKIGVRFVRGFSSCASHSVGSVDRVCTVCSTLHTYTVFDYASEPSLSVPLWRALVSFGASVDGLRLFYGNVL